MGRNRRKNLPFLENVEILDAGSEGKAIAKVDEKILFVKGAIPGDICDIQVTKKKKSYLEGRVKKVVQKSPIREEAFCAHFGVCGGCKWQEMNYAKQTEFKQKQVHDNFKHLGKFEFPEIETILGSEKTKYYRNKLEFTFSNKRWLLDGEVENAEEKNLELQLNALGFHVPGRFDKIVDVDHCYLQGDDSNAIRNEVRRYALENSLSFFDLKQQEGLLRNLIIRTTSTGETMVVVAFYENDKTAIDGLMQHLQESFPDITSLLYVVNPKKNDTIGDLDILTYSGKDFIEEEMEGIKFRIGPKSFYQTNSDQAYELYKITREFAGLNKEDIVYDLYTGTGTIANFVAKSVKKVIGVEYVPEAIVDAKINSENNGIENTSFFAGDMKDVLNNDFVEKHGRPSVIITDPPRAGMHENVVNTILNAAPEKIVYVSCNPATQARDLNLLWPTYKVERVRPVDMFPHTHHVENVVLLTKAD